MAPAKDADDFEEDDDEDDFDSDEDDDDDDSDGSDLEGAANPKVVIAKLEADIEGSPFNAELHAALIGSLREAANLNRLRTVRRRAAAMVVLPESLWFEWLQDETNLADDNDLEELKALHEQACIACPLSSRIWLATCALSRRQSSSKDQIESVRETYETALDILGMHPHEGPELWADYRDYEETLLQGLEDKAAYSQQVHRVRALFLRQLALPLPGLDRLSEIYATFDSGLDASYRDPMAAAKAEAISSEGREGWQQRESIEKRLLDASRPMVSIVQAGSTDQKGSAISAELLALEEASGDPKRIFLGHLRATHWAPSEESRWHSFVLFLSTTLKEPKKLVAVLERAVRNCPFSQDLWLRLHLEHESLSASLAELQKLTERGVDALRKSPESKDAGIVALLLQHADACRRSVVVPSPSDNGAVQEGWVQMRAMFERAAGVAESAKDGSNCQVLMQWLRLEAYAARNPKSALDVGNRLMKLWGGYYNGWSTFIAAMRFCTVSDAYSTVRDLYHRAVGQVADYPAQIRSDHVQFERECGTLASWREARDTEAEMQCSDVTQAVASDGMDCSEQPLAAAAEEETQIGAEAKQKKRAGNVSGHEKKKRRRAKEAEEAAAEEDSENDGDLKEASVKGKAASTTPTEKKDTQPPEATEQPNIAQKESEKEKLTAKAIEKPTNAIEKPAKATENKGAERQEAPTSAVKPNGKENAKEAEPVHGSAKNENEAHKGSHYHQKRLVEGDAVPLQPEAEGDQTVYVSNLDWSVDEAQLRRLFGEIDGMKDVRLVRDFLQRSKGYAYVDYEKSKQVNQAVEKLNGVSVNKRAMFVARSLPTKPLFEEKTIFVKNLGASATENDVRAAFSPKGEILGVRMPTEESTGSHKGYAYVEFASASSMDDALALDGVEIGGQKSQVARSIPMKDHRHQKAAARKDLPSRSNQKQILQGQEERSDPVKLAEKFPTTIYVKNLAFQVDENKLRDHFAKCGEVQKVMVCKNAQGRSRGFGFVEFANKDQAQDALAYNDTVLCGREIWVSKSQRAITQKGLEYGGTKPASSTKEPAIAEDAPKVAGAPGAAKRRLDLGEAKEKETGAAAKVKKTQPDTEAKQFRSAKAAQAKTPSDNDANGKECSDEASTDTVAKPLSNADFRAMMLGKS